jgi:LPS O-antigen subunit length determinant protein (WzzB/FepE family)
MEKHDYNLTNERDNLFRFIWQKRRTLLIFTTIVFVFSLIVSFLIKPVYLSTAIVFPAASSSVSFSEQRNLKAAAMDFGEEGQAEQLVQILQSARIKNRVIEKYDLYKHYGIDSKDPNKNFKLNEKYISNFTFTRTRFGSIQIDVLDQDPFLAAEMANGIVDLIDTVKNEMINERTKPALEINKRKMLQLELERDSILNILDTLSKLGVSPLDVRSRLFQALVDSKSPAEKQQIQQKIDVNTRYGSQFDALVHRRNEMIIKIEEFRVSYEQAESDANANFTHKFIVEKAVVADKKEKPKRLIIVLVAVLGGFIFGVFYLLIKQRIQELKLNS